MATDPSSHLYPLVRSALGLAIKEQAVYQDPELTSQFRELLLRLRTEYRLWLLNRRLIQSELWPLIRQEEALLNLLMRIALGFHQRLQGQNGQDYYQDYVNTLAQQYTRISGAGQTDELLREHLREEFNWYQVVFEKELWLTTLITMESDLRTYLPLLNPDT